ncbi:flavodoxin family protein [Bacteroidia bacterium]|nr:flavodoxin family protein [Bacteroidia bacterium]
MNILVINGSPKGENSTTLKLTKAFLAGIDSDESHLIDIITVTTAHIEPCRGCFCCMAKGVCAFKDDMQAFLKKYLAADVVIWSFPLYFYSMPSKIKTFLDRLLPIYLPYIVTTVDGRVEHPTRYDIERQKHILISTCGFYNIQGNYDALLKQVEILFGKRFISILCPEGYLFDVHIMQKRTGRYLSYIQKAGEEYFTQGYFSEFTQTKLNELLCPSDLFIEMTNSGWMK